MAERSIIDQLDDAVTELLAGREPAVADRELTELVAVARELRGLPSEQFRAALKEQLGGEVSTAAKQVEATPQQSFPLTPYLCYRDAAAAIGPEPDAQASLPQPLRVRRIDRRPLRRGAA